MYLYLFDRGDRLGANITNYIAQILYAYNNNYFIKFDKEKNDYKYYDSIFVKPLFDYIEKYNEKYYTIEMCNHCDCEYKFENQNEYINTITNVLKNIKTDFITFFLNNIFHDIKPIFTNLALLYSIPFDINKTILVHLRLDDVAHSPDYDGSICSNYYKNKIMNDENCFYENQNNTINYQAPLSKTKLDNIINKAKQEFTDYKVILITSPTSDTTFLDYNYEVIKSNDESLDLYLLTMCNVVILSRSTFALSCLFYNDSKIKTYIPLWGHFVCHGLDTIYDKNDKSKIEYFA